MMAKRFASHKRTLESLSSVTKGNSFQVSLRIGETSPTDADALPISKFRCYVSLRRSLRDPHHIGASHFTSTDADEAGIFAHLFARYLYFARKKKGQEFPALRLLRLAEIVRPVEAPQERPELSGRPELAHRLELLKGRREGVAEAPERSRPERLVLRIEVVPVDDR